MARFILWASSIKWDIACALPAQWQGAYDPQLRPSVADDRRVRKVTEAGFGRVIADTVSHADGLVARTVAGIIALIRTENLHIGDSLPSENALTQRLGVSRVVVREANRSLSALGILDIGNGRAARVSVPDYATFGMMFDHVVYTNHVSVQQVLAVRRSIEISTVTLAAVHRTEAEAQAILAHAAGMRRDFTQPAAVMEHDLQLHVAIAEAARNPMFTTMVRAFESVSRANWAIGWQSRAGEAGRWKMIEVHEAIARAVANGDASAAHSAMSAHFDDTVLALDEAGADL